MAIIIDDISINEVFWLGAKKHMISFRFFGMPEDVHFSISFNANSTDVNFHVTRNIGDPASKPKIEIARIAKNDLEELSSYLAGSICNVILQPLHLKSHGRRTNHLHYGIQFCPLNKWKDNFDNSIKEKLIDEFKSISKIRKRSRLKIKGDIESRFRKIFTDSDFVNSFKDNLRWLPRKFSEHTLAGIIISRKFTGCALCINNKWYAFRENIKPLDFLSEWMEPSLAKNLVFKTLMAYVRIRQLTSSEQSNKIHEVIRLYKII